MSYVLLKKSTQYFSLNFIWQVVFFISLLPPWLFCLIFVVNFWNKEVIPVVRCACGYKEYSTELCWFSKIVVVVNCNIPDLTRHRKLARFLMPSLTSSSWVGLKPNIQFLAVKDMWLPFSIPWCITCHDGNGCGSYVWQLSRISEFTFLTWKPAQYFLKPYKLDCRKEDCRSCLILLLQVLWPKWSTSSALESLFNILVSTKDYTYSIYCLRSK